MTRRRTRRDAAERTVHGIDRWAVLKEGLVTKAREIFPGKDA